MQEPGTIMPNLGGFGVSRCCGSGKRKEIKYWRVSMWNSPAKCAMRKEERVQQWFPKAANTGDRDVFIVSVEDNKSSRLYVSMNSIVIANESSNLG